MISMASFAVVDGSFSKSAVRLPSKRYHLYFVDVLAIIYSLPSLTEASLDIIQLSCRSYLVYVTSPTTSCNIHRPTEFHQLSFNGERLRRTHHMRDRAFWRQAQLSKYGRLSYATAIPGGGFPAIRCKQSHVAAGSEPTRTSFEDERLGF